MDAPAIATVTNSRYASLMRFEQIFAAVVLLTAAAATAAALRPESPPSVPPASTIPITATPLPLNSEDPGQTSIGPLKFMGAVQLRSPDPLFGGISGLRAGKPTSDGVQLLAITDTGNWLAFTTIEKNGRLTGIANAIMAPLPQPDGKPAATKRAVDAEALEWDPATGAAMVAYEQDHRFAYFSNIDPANPASLAAPPIRTDRLTHTIAWPGNNGAEATALLPGGTRIAIAESTSRPDGAHVALITRNGITSETTIPGVADHSPTDAIALDADTLLILHRRVSMLGGFGAALTRLRLDTMQSTLLAKWQSPVAIDNMEGLALHRDQGRTFLYIVSDDNLNGLQRTLLLKFELLLP